MNFLDTNRVIEYGIFREGFQIFYYCLGRRRVSNFAFSDSEPLAGEGSQITKIGRRSDSNEDFTPYKLPFDFQNRESRKNQNFYLNRLAAEKWFWSEIERKKK